MTGHLAVRIIEAAWQPIAAAVTGLCLAGRAGVKRVRRRSR